MLPNMKNPFLWPRKGESRTNIEAQVDYLKSIISPASKLHDASLLIERKILNIHLTGRMVDGWRLPFNQTIVVKSCLCSERHLKITVSTKKEGLIARPNINKDLLIIKHYIRQPYVSRRQMKQVNPSEILGLPDQLVIIPELLNPQVCGHYLV